MTFMYPNDYTPEQFGAAHEPSGDLPLRVIDMVKTGEGEYSAAATRTRKRQLTTIQEKFESFHVAHPEVYQKLVELALEVKATGLEHYGIGALWERCRWHFQFDYQGEAFKLNNIFRSRYARKIMADIPELSGFFETRQLLAA